jgi:hypothetical protein
MRKPFKTQNAAVTAAFSIVPVVPSIFIPLVGAFGRESSSGLRHARTWRLDRIGAQDCVAKRPQRIITRPSVSPLRPAMPRTAGRYKG